MSVAETIVKEHHLIRDFVDKVQVGAEIQALGENPPSEFFALAIDFVETFIDQYHHIKEEEILFPILVEKMAGRIDNEFKTLQNQHARADVHLREAKRCLKGYATGEVYQTSIFWKSLGNYTSFLRSHLNKENHVFLPLIDRVLNEEEQEEVERLSEIEVNKLGRGYLENCKKTLDEMTKVLNDRFGHRYRYLLNSVSSKKVNYRAA
jgi:hemerythrin-like domain-containing protein